MAQAYFKWIHVNRQFVLLWLSNHEGQRIFEEGCHEMYGIKSIFCYDKITNTKICFLGVYIYL